MQQVACFTGHRPRRGFDFAPGHPSTRALAARIDDAILLLCNERGVRVFLCGMAAGFDLFAARRLVALRQSGCIDAGVRLVAVLPYPEHESDLPLHWQRAHREVLLAAQDRYVVSPAWRRDAFARRNACLIAQAGYVIAFWNHNPRTGTGQTVRMAHQSERVVLNLYDL